MTGRFQESRLDIRELSYPIVEVRKHNCGLRPFTMDPSLCDRTHRTADAVG